jgi:hypothetical protein
MAEREVIDFPFSAQLGPRLLFPTQSLPYNVRLFPAGLAPQCVSQINAAERSRELIARNGEIR